MLHWILELHLRNALLHFFGWLCLLGGIICTILTITTTAQVNNINAFVKPAKFFYSVWIFCWTIAWLIYELQQPATINSYSIMVVVVMTIELAIITWQAANGRLSHFNTRTPLYTSLFTIMGVAISILTAWTLVMGGLFFGKQVTHLPPGYLWGIRLGILLFVIFSFQGGMMGAKLQHTVGAADGSSGLPILNWSKQYGDLRIAHFFGIHALQLLPLLGYYVFKHPAAIITASVAYAGWVSFTLVKALRGLPLIS
jgi:hypothetical protein